MNDESSKYRAGQEATQPKAATDAQVVDTIERIQSHLDDMNLDREALVEVIDSLCESALENRSTVDHPAPSQAVGAVDAKADQDHIAQTRMMVEQAVALRELAKRWLDDAPLQQTTPIDQVAHARSQALLECAFSLVTTIDRITPRPAPVDVGYGVVWRCFHCDETFTNRDEAALHFGTSERQSPACLIDISEYRAMEYRMVRYNDEDADIHRAMARMQMDHARALQRAEEDGYAKALKDTGYTDTPRPAVATAGDGVTKLLEFVANTIELFDDATMQNDYMIDAGEAAGIVRALDGSPYALASPSAGAVVPEGWLPIETAPNDGTMHVRGLHVYGPDGAFLYWDALTGYVDEEDGAFYDMGGDDLAGWGADDFTHWHPLAAAPESGGV